MTLSVYAGEVVEEGQVLAVVKNPELASQPSGEDTGRSAPTRRTIAVRIDRLADGACRVQVLDRGRDMDDEVMRNAILPFYSTKPSGSGVGLPLCREIVEAHGGHLRIQNRPGGGTVVSFWLPGRA